MSKKGTVNVTSICRYLPFCCKLAHERDRVPEFTGVSIEVTLTVQRMRKPSASCMKEPGKECRYAK